MFLLKCPQRKKTLENIPIRKNSAIVTFRDMDATREEKRARVSRKGWRKRRANRITYTVHVIGNPSFVKDFDVPLTQCFRL